jgi:hypothetical protein
MQKQLEDLGPQMFAQNPRLRPGKRRPTLGEDLLALEQPILREVCFETLIKPLLARFDEKVGKQLESK